MLQIARVQEEDAGRYKCQAVNEAGEDHVHFELEILSRLHQWTEVEGHRLFNLKMLFFRLITFFYSLTRILGLSV